MTAEQLAERVAAEVGVRALKTRLPGRGRAVCVGYSVGKRPKERRRQLAGFVGPSTSRLADVRAPGVNSVFDDE